MQEFKEFLQSIFLSKNEAEIYVSLLNSKPSTILEISKMTKLHRSNVYDSIRDLINKGLVVESELNKKKIFLARSPSNILSYLKEKEIEFDNVISNINLNAPQSVESKVFLSKGKLALKNVINSLLENSKEICVYGIPINAHEAIGPMITDFHKRRLKSKVSMRHIYNAEAIDRARYLNSLNYTEARILPSKYSSSTTMNVTDDKVVIIVWNKDVTIIEIHDKDVADSYKTYFEILWLKAKKVD